MGPVLIPGHSRLSLKRTCVSHERQHSRHSCNLAILFANITRFSDSQHKEELWCLQPCHRFLLTQTLSSSKILFPLSLIISAPQKLTWKIEDKSTPHAARTFTRGTLTRKKYLAEISGGQRYAAPSSKHDLLPSRLDDRERSVRNSAAQTR